jgi:hypothetical protein
VFEVKFNYYIMNVIEPKKYIFVTFLYVYNNSNYIKYAFFGTVSVAYTENIFVMDTMDRVKIPLLSKNY